jgi:TolB protein
VRAIAATLASVAIAASACTTPPKGAERAVASVDALPGLGGGERLLVLTEDGSVITTDPDGGTPVMVRPGGLDDVTARQPVWSPDAGTLAWVEVGSGGPPATSRLVTARPDGSGRAEVEIDTAMFFLEWDPTSSRVAYLGSYGDAIGMGVAQRDATGRATAATLAVGRPFYLAWAPDGDHLFVHVGTESLGSVDLRGELTPVGDDPGHFHAPVWLPDGRLVYAATEGGRQTLLIREGDRSTQLVRFRGTIEFVVSPDGRRIAYRVDTRTRLGSVSVVETGTGRSVPVTRGPVTAFQWSPDGRRLLLMTPEDSDVAPFHRWRWWDGDRVRSLGPRFVPSPTYLRDYVPFFGQYAQTMTPWSPDGRAFAFPGLIGGRAGIWVQALDSDEPRFVVDGGTVVAWSPAET